MLVKEMQWTERETFGDLGGELDARLLAYNNCGLTYNFYATTLNLKIKFFH
jgi:hypothetical protein